MGTVLDCGVVVPVVIDYTYLPPNNQMRAVMLKPELQTVVEQLCEDGCNAVNQYITDIQTGHCPASMQQLKREECEAVLVELKSIMAVYDHKGA